MPPSVIALAVTPVKGTRLQPVQSLELTRTGARGNREFFVIDERDRMVNGKHVGELQQIVASFTPPHLRLRFPDGTEISDAVQLGEPVSARFYSRSVEGRLLLGPFSEAISELAGRRLRLVHANGAVDRGARGAVTLISRASLEALAAAASVDEVDGRRFRMLLEVEGLSPHEEDEWVGHSARIGSSALVRFRGHVGRCLVTSRDPESGDIDLPTLDILRDYRGSAETTEALPFGIYGEVLEPGVVYVGDVVRELQTLRGTH